MTEEREYRILMNWEVFGLPEPTNKSVAVSQLAGERPDIARVARKLGMANLTNAERFDRIWDMTAVAEKVKGGINRIFDPNHRLFGSPFSRFARYIWGTEAIDNGNEWVVSTLMKAEARGFATGKI